MRDGYDDNPDPQITTEAVVEYRVRVAEPGLRLDRLLLVKQAAEGRVEPEAAM